MVEAEEVAPAFSGEVPRSTYEEGPMKFAPDVCRERLFMSRAWEWEGSRRDTGMSGAFPRHGQVGFGFLVRTSRCACAVGLHFSRAGATFSPNQLHLRKLVMKNPEMCHLSHLCTLPRVQTITSSRVRLNT